MQKIIGRIALLVVFVILVVLVVLVPPPPTTQATVGDITIDQSVGGSSTLGIVTAQKLVDTASSTYFIDPAATGNSLVTAGDATVSGNIALGNAKTIRSAFGPLSLQYKSGLDAWTTGLTLQDTTGNVGIGTTGPATPLHVVSSTVNGRVATFDNAATSTQSYYDFKVAGTLRGYLRIDSVGNFLINPTGTGRVYLNYDSGTGGVFFANGAGSTVGAVTSAGNLSMDGTGTFGTNAVINGGGVSYFNGGNVGIGTTGPTQLLHLRATATNVKLRIDNNTSGGGAQTSELSLYNKDDGTVFYEGAAVKSIQTNGTNSIAKSDMAFFTGQTWDGSTYGSTSERMRITTGGNVGIGTAGPATKLDIRNDLSAAPTLTIGTTGTSATSGNLVGALDFYNSDADIPSVAGYVRTLAGPSFGVGGVLVFGTQETWNTGILRERMRIDNSGNVGIGTTTPSTALQVVGTITGTTKNFEIDHPTKPGMKLIHSTVEGPEVAVFYRGEGKLTQGKAVITLPEYFEALTKEEGRTVQLTAKNGWSPLYVDGEVAHGTFTVKADSGNSDQQFFWEVKAVRADVAPLVVEKSVN